MSGVARFAPYQAGASRLALDPIRFQASADGATNFDTVALLDGPFPDGRVQAFRLPLNGRLGPAGAFSVGRGCIVASWRFFQIREIAVRADATAGLPDRPGDRLAASRRRPAHRRAR